MKTYMQEIEMITYFKMIGNPIPLKFKIIPDEERVKKKFPVPVIEPRVIKIERVLSHQEEKIAGIPFIKYTYEIISNQHMRYIELKYDILTLKWYLY